MEESDEQAQARSRAEAVANARTWLACDPLILDTETTGLGQDAEIVEIAIVDHSGHTVFHSLVRPKRPMSDEVVSIHGITNDMVSTAPTWAEIHERVCALLSGRLVVIYNAGYDVRLMGQTMWMYRLDSPEFEAQCVMRAYAQFFGEWNDYRGDWAWQKLTVAAQQCRVPIGQAHRAEADALAALGVLKTIANGSLPKIDIDTDIPY